MPRKPVSKTKAAQITSKIKARLYAHAVALYQEEENKPSSEKKKGLRTICNLVVKEYQTTTRHPNLDVTLNYITLLNLYRGSTSIQDFNLSKAWLSTKEEEEVIKALIQFSKWGIPLSYSQLQEQVNTICTARLGKRFPKTGVGKCWAQRFVERHSD
ncbi:hypothetical protein FA15DRAFT_601141 [Coprinopsis marcescibilis]|uniref:HTH CENPB-type domain-containing protein n=1 Tax=Coprinopsis marcescibilis TaxID=230819 RepID=A0A5C3KIB1_COPMA|nr:hypothetical protein FA15DRAFT_601141 [Coprinopsis marcescibilis]